MREKCRSEIYDFLLSYYQNVKGPFPGIAQERALFCGSYAKLISQGCLVDAVGAGDEFYEFVFRLFICLEHMFATMV